MDEQKFKDIFSDDEFVNRLLELETGERVCKALAERGIVLAPEDIDKFAEGLLEALSKQKENIENVSGGVSSVYESEQKIANMVMSIQNFMKWPVQ